MPVGALIPVRSGRPATVMLAGGWTVFVSVHDAEYMRMVKVWKQRLAQTHPDRHPRKEKKAARQFRRITGQRNRWLTAEVKWYAELGLLPPNGFTGRVKT